MKLHYENKSIEPLEGEYFKEYPLNPQYLASNLGRVKSKNKPVNHNHGGKAIKKERIMTQTDNGSGYLSVGLTTQGKTKTVRVSRIVALTFIENKENKPQVNHINGIKKDNRVENLEWNTCGENVRHAWNNDLAKKQESFLYVQKRLSEINQYIAFKPKVITPIGIGTIIIDQASYRIEYENGKYENLVKSLRFWKDEFKLIVHNLSDLTQEIEHNGEKFVPIERLFNETYAANKSNQFYYDEQINYVRCWHNNTSYHKRIFIHPELIGGNSFEDMEKLKSWHFDVFGLIKKGLAIDIKEANNA